LPQTADASEKAAVEALTTAITAALTQRQAKAAAEPTDATTPVDLWAAANPPVLPEGLLPERFETFARAAAKIVGADVGGFAMAALTASAAAIPDSIQLRPMRHSPWTESARIWVAEVGDPSARKTAIISAASAALKREDRRRYQDYLGKKAFFDALAKEDQKTPTNRPRSASSSTTRRSRPRRRSTRRRPKACSASRTSSADGSG
jgi:Protein of unknown function (DUF3987)